MSDGDWIRASLRRMIFTYNKEHEQPPAAVRMRRDTWYKLIESVQSGDIDLLTDGQFKIFGLLLIDDYQMPFGEMALSRGEKRGGG